MKGFIHLIVVLPLLMTLSAQIILSQKTHSSILLGERRGMLGKVPVAFNDRVWSLQFTADGRELLSVTDSIHRTKCSDGISHTIWAPSGDDSIVRAIFSPNGSLFARSNQGSLIYIHETSSGKILHTIEGRTPMFSEPAWSPDGDKIAIGSDKDVVVHALGVKNSARRIVLGGEDVESLKWSPDGQWLAVFTESNKNRKGPTFLVQITNEPVVPIRIPGDSDVIFSFAPDSKSLVVNGREKNIGFFYLWDISHKKEIVRIESGEYNEIKHSPDGRLLVAGGLNELRVLDARNLADVTRRAGDLINNHVWSLAFSPDGSQLAYGVENRIRIRDTRSWDEINPDDVLRASVSSIAFSSDGKYLVSGCGNGDIVMWDWQKKTPVWKKIALPDQWPISAISIDPSSRWVGVVQSPYTVHDASMRLIHFATGEPHLALDSASKVKAAPLFSQAGDIAYVANSDHEIQVVDCTSGDIRHRFPMSANYGVIESMAFESRNQMFIRWSSDNLSVGRLDLKKGELIDVNASERRKNEIDITPTRTHEFLAASAHVLNLPSQQLSIRPQNNDQLPCVRHPSELLYFFARDHMVSVCDLLSQSVITQFDVGPGNVEAIAITPDGLTLVAATSGGLKYLSLEGAPIADGTPLDTLWKLMGGDNHWMAYQAAWAMARQPNFIAFLDKQLPNAEEPSESLIITLKKQMWDSAHEVRQTAARQWLDFGYDLDKEILDSLGEGGIKSKWPQFPASHPMLLSSGVEGMERPVPPLLPLSAHRQAMRAVMLLKSNRSAAATSLLLRLADGFAKAPLSINSKRALDSISIEAR